MTAKNQYKNFQFNSSKKKSNKEYFKGIKAFFQDERFHKTSGLFLVLILDLIWPSKDEKYISFIANAGAVIFALWTVKDMKDSVCRSPHEKSIRVFLDLLNLFNFSVMGSR